MTLPSPVQVHGTWKLEAFEIESPNGELSRWGNQSHGLLVYTPDGHVSVAINKEVEADPEQTEEQNLFDSILFYAGTYQIEGEIIRHQVTLASNPARIGKEMIRYAKLTENLLTLTTPQESFGRAILKWRKI